MKWCYVEDALEKIELLLDLLNIDDFKLINIIFNFYKLILLKYTQYFQKFIFYN